MRLTTIVLAVGVALTLLGCTPDYDCGALVYDTRVELCVCPTGSVLVDGGTCVPLDGGVAGDGAVDVPSAPEVSIEPANPRTDDALTVRVDSESVDPRGELVTYDVRWLRDGMVVDGPTTRVDATLTSRDEEWTVEVTPRTADGRFGAMGTAQVTIGNSAPSIGTARLTSYRPIEGETTTVRTSGLEDADGDAVRLEYAWSIDDAPALAISGATLATSSELARAGSRIRVDVTPFDGTHRGEPLSVFAAVLPDVTRWRELYPTRSYQDSPITIFDSVHRRVLLHHSPRPDASPGEGSLWELPLDGADHRPVKLHPEGTSPATLGRVVVFDPEEQRVIVFGGLVREGEYESSVWILDTSRRGAERWFDVEIAGESPSPRMFSAGAIDPTGHRLWVYGGVDASGLLGDLWSLDLARSPAVWTRHAETTAGARFGASLVHDATRHRLVLVGGASTAFPAFVDTVHHIDLEDSASDFVLAPARLPAPLGVTMAAIDAGDDRALFAFGMTSGLVPQREVVALALDTLEVTTLPLEGDAPESAAFGTMVWDTAGSRFVAVPGSRGFDELATSLEVYSLDPIDGIWSHEVDSADAAPSLERASAMRSGAGRLWIVGGRDGFDRVSRDVWEVSADTGAWARIATTPDAITSRTPPPRYGAIFDAGDSIDSPIAQFGGRREGGSLSDTVAWQLRGSAWVESTLESGSAPAARDGAATYRNRCGELGLFGGELEDTTLSSESTQLACDGADPRRGCRWIRSVDSGARPSARAWSTMTRVGETHVLAFGGRTAAGPSADVWALDGCSIESTWTSVTPSGIGPGARYGHAASFAPGSGSRPPGVIIFGGAGDGPDDLMRDAWRLVQVTSTTYRWESIDPAHGTLDELPLGRRDAVTVYDPVAERLLVYGGRSEEVLGDLWELRIR